MKLLLVLLCISSSLSAMDRETTPQNEYRREKEFLWRTLNVYSTSDEKLKFVAAALKQLRDDEHLLPPEIFNAREKAINECGANIAQ